MELVANIWPIVDEQSGLIYRILARAYTLEAPDDVISSTLKALAPKDYHLASSFALTARFRHVTEHGTLEGCLHISDFATYESMIIVPIIEQLEGQFAKLQGVNMSTGEPIAVAHIPRFGKEPYVITTFVMESINGELTPSL
ncbi:hypothetical protein HW115_05110 [Verrucomicrobiaceae bacterium N1E253]|uniref:Uncharacterized protein n=2 Tax=Oceaniferula marina TaxID=2748318 RepID=A0A851GIM6_9BACT|nr:hypothetical protein [Oceaniferula marina]